MSLSGDDPSPLQKAKKTDSVKQRTSSCIRVPRLKSSSRLINIDLSPSKSSSCPKLHPSSSQHTSKKHKSSPHPFDLNEAPIDIDEHIQASTTTNKKQKISQSSSNLNGVDEQIQGSTTTTCSKPIETQLSQFINALKIIGRPIPIEDLEAVTGIRGLSKGKKDSVNGELYEALKSDERVQVVIEEESKEVWSYKKSGTWSSNEDRAKQELLEGTGAADLTMEEFLAWCRIPPKDAAIWMLIRRHQIHHWSVFIDLTPVDLINSGFAMGPAHLLSKGVSRLELSLFNK